MHATTRDDIQQVAREFLSAENYVLANAGPSATAASRKRVIAASVREVARALGDTPAVARASYIDPRLVTRYESEGELPGIPAHPAELPAPAETETAIANLLASCGDGLLAAGDLSADDTD